MLVVATWLCACGRDQTVTDDQLGGLIVEARQVATVDLDQATKDPAELSRAVTLPFTSTIRVLGPHAWTIDTLTVVEEGAAKVEELSDHAVLELGADGAFRGLYTNSADYGREAIYLGGKLYLRPRYQKWHGRTPESADEPGHVRDGYVAAIAAVWDLVAPGAELTDKGAVHVAGRPGRKVAVKLSPSPRDNPHEPLSQKKWREARTVTALDGELVLDADHGVVLAAKLTGAIAFTRGARRFAMKLQLDATVGRLGVTAIAAPADTEVIAAPTRMREVDERDYLLHGIAPPIRKTADGTAREPTPPKPGKP